MLKSFRSGRSMGPWIRSTLFSVAAVALFAGANAGVAQDMPTEAPRAPAAPGPESVEESFPSVLAQFTTGVEEREPIDQVSFVENKIRRIFFYTDLRALGGQTVTHRWTYAGRTMAEVPFAVGGPRWRVWSSKELQPEWIGDWTVEIVSQNGEVIAAETFAYTAAND